MLSSASYNQLEQMSSVTPAGGSALAMSYQGLGQALRVSHGSVSQVEDQLGLELESGSSAASFTRDADGTILGEETGGSRYYFLFDANGSVVTVVDSLGVVADTFRYSPYGTTTSSTGSVYEPIRFDGGYHDTAAGGEALVKFGERYYDPSTGRWTSQGPDNNPLTTEGWHRHDYAGDDPANELDPSGMFSFTHFAIGLYETADAFVSAGAAVAIVGGCAAGGLFSGGVGIAVLAVPCAVGAGGAVAAAGFETAAAYKSFHEAFASHGHHRRRRRRP